jgi:hypothetical protein
MKNELTSKVLEEFLDDLTLDVDFDAKTGRFEVKTPETDYQDLIEYPTLTQLINKNYEEFLDAIFIDLEPIIQIEISKIEPEDQKGYEYMIDSMSIRQKPGSLNRLGIHLHQFWHKDYPELNIEDVEFFIDKMTEKGFTVDEIHDIYTLTKKLEKTKDLIDFVNTYDEYSKVYLDRRSLTGFQRESYTIKGFKDFR